MPADAIRPHFGILFHAPPKDGLVDHPGGGRYRPAEPAGARRQRRAGRAAGLPSPPGRGRGRRVRTPPNSSSSRRLTRCNPVAGPRSVDHPRRMTDVVVRRFVPDDWATLREVRLAALLDAPYAFLSTYAEVSTWDEAAWRDRPVRSAMFGAWIDGRPLGMCGLIPPAASDDPAGGSALVAMWVAPDRARPGPGRRPDRGGAGGGAGGGGAERRARGGARQRTGRTGLPAPRVRAGRRHAARPGRSRHAPPPRLIPRVGHRSGFVLGGVTLVGLAAHRSPVRQGRADYRPRGWPRFPGPGVRTEWLVRHGGRSR